MIVHDINAFMGMFSKWQRGLLFLCVVTGCSLSLVFVSGCHKPAEPKTQRQLDLEKMKKLPLDKMPAGPSTEEAVKYLIQLRRNGQLPDTEDASPNLDFHIDPFSTNYPMSRTIIVKMTNSHCANHYVLVKSDANSSWSIKTSWRTDAEGKTNKVYTFQ